MAVEWTAHRFSGGLLVLDITNTVVLRDDPLRTFDRFSDAGELPRFAAAASLHRSDELGGARLVCPDADDVVAALVGFREHADDLFRRSIAGEGFPSARVSAFAAACGVLMAGCDTVFGRPGAPFGPAGREVRLQAAAAWSGLSLLCAPEARRLRICGNCGWLFVDRSRNGSRLWCDMAVCGNRQKARRHYRRHRHEKEHDHG
ncbi:MAG: CGNR zinc finger domain-containing protein [Rhizobiaceae bacterium]|nr:CGNR zinc finger domain-containing protein [Rhizobiaceae bacterium]